MAKARRKHTRAASAPKIARPFGDASKFSHDQIATFKLKVPPALATALKIPPELMNAVKGPPSLKEWSPTPSQAEVEQEIERAKARETLDRAVAIRDNQIPPRWAKKLLRELASRIETPSQPVSTAPAEQSTTTKSRIEAEIRQMKTDGKIPAKVTDFAKALKGRMETAARLNRSIRPVSWRYIKNQLPGWGFWPIDRI
jgi:hypothetical protein